MAREKTKKDPAEYSVEEKLANLYALQSMLSEIDSIKTLRGELPLEVQDLEDEIEGMTTRIEKIGADIAELKREISDRNAKIAENNASIERYKQQMDNVRNNREFDSLTKQVEYAELDNQLHEKKIREAKEVVEAKTAEMTRCNLEVNDRRVMLERSSASVPRTLKSPSSSDCSTPSSASVATVATAWASSPYSATHAAAASTKFRPSVSSTSAAARKSSSANTADAS